MAGYKISGQWDMDNQRNFYGEEYIRFLADLPTPQGVNTSVGIYLPSSLRTGAEYEELELAPGTKILKLVPFTIIVGDSTDVPRDPFITSEDLNVEAISVRAIPASGIAY